MAAYQTDDRKVKPIRELRFNRQGALLACTEARYDDLTSYIMQLGAPVSQLQGAQCFTFAEPIENVFLLVECLPIDWCGQCDTALANCTCPF